MSSPEILENPIIPETMLTNCPKVTGSLVRVGVACTGCNDFVGLADRFPNGPQAFEVRYLVRCTHEPVKRPIVRLAEGV